MPSYGNPQGPPDWYYSMPPTSGFGYDPGGSHATNPYDYAGYSPSPYPSATPSPTASPSAPAPPGGYPIDVGVPGGPWTPPSDLPGTGNQPPPGGYPINVGVPTAPGGASNPFGGVGPTGNYNYYDAGNGTVYVYDQNWQYVGTSMSPQGPMGAPQGPATSSSSGPSVPQGQPVSGGSPPPAWVGAEAHPQAVVGQSGWEGTGSSYNFLVPGGVTAKNI
jgi:hypothetical protein